LSKNKEASVCLAKAICNTSGFQQPCTLTCSSKATGTSTVVSYIESAAGVAAGGRTGVAAIVTGLLFLAALFVAP